MVTKSLFTSVLAGLAVCVAIGCGSSSSAVEPDVDEFDLDPIDQAELDGAAADGLGADGSYSYDDQAGTLTITLTTSDFGCGPTQGTIVAIVTQLTPTTMVWAFADGDGGVTWTRVDAGTEGVVGVWRTNDPELFLILSSDGSAQLFGRDDMCDDDRPRNSNGCLELGLTGLDITTDGDVNDWAGVTADAVIDDAQDDYVGSDSGADLRALKVEYGRQALYVLMEIHGGPTTTFQDGPAPNGGVYRITVQGDNGLSISDRVRYVPESSSWQMVGPTPQLTMAASDAGIEFEVDVSAYAGEGFSSIDLIMVEAMDCSGGTCERLDDMDCGYIAVPQ